MSFLKVRLSVEYSYPGNIIPRGMCVKARAR